MIGNAAQEDVDVAEVRGQGHVKRALEVAAAGDHNILLTGPPGSGKTMLARRISKTLPAHTFEEALESTKTLSSVSFALLTIRFPMPDGSEAVLILARVKSL